jgi:hypothetical protein
MKGFLILILAFIPSLIVAQTITLSNAEEVVTTAIAEFDASMKNGQMKEFKTESGVEGIYVFEITIKAKGQIASVAIVERKEGTVAHQNVIKDYLMKYQFGFKTPKKSLYKFQYEFNFNN